MFKPTLIASVFLYAYVAFSAPVAQRDMSPSTWDNSTDSTGGGSQVNIGDITYYAPGLGACGWNSDATDPTVVALSHVQWDTYAPGVSNGNPVCGTKINATAPNGMSQILTVVDECMGCNSTSIDLSPAAFDSFQYPESDGRVHGVAWFFVDGPTQAAA